MMFLAGETGEGGGGGPASDVGLTRGAQAFEPTPKTSAGEQPLPTKPSEGPKGAETPSEPEPGAQPAFDPAKFAETFGTKLGDVLKPVIEQVQTPAEPQMTPEEARRILNVWEPDDNWYAQYDNLETRKDAVASMRDALITQADTLAQMRMREMIDAFKQEILPGIQNVQQTANQQREERFHSTYPLLAKPELRPLVDAIATDLHSRGQTFKTETEVFKAIANGVEAVLKVNNPEFKLETAETGGGQQTNDRGGRQLPVTTPGGGGGTGRRESGQKPAKPRGIAIFDKV